MTDLNSGAQPPREPAPDNEAALAFLRTIGGPCQLSAIDPEKKRPLVTRTFAPDAEDAARKFLEKFNGNRNLYWAINPPEEGDDKKSKRTDITQVRFLHVDLDPRAGEDVEQERKRILALLTTNLPKGVVRPSFIIDSGGGYWGLWKLTASIPINGNLEAAENAKRYNQRLELQFGGDNCHNIDRIARLPGSINIPDEKKRKKGRKPALASVIWSE